MRICEAEQVNLQSDSVIDKLIQLTEGDLRRSINTLQTCASYTKVQGLSETELDKVSGKVPNKAILMITTVIGTRGATYADIQRVAENLIFDGYDCQQLLHQLLDFYVVQQTRDVKDLQKAQISEIIASTDFQLLQGGNEELNMLNCLSNIA